MVPKSSWHSSHGSGSNSLAVTSGCGEGRAGKDVCVQARCDLQGPSDVADQLAARVATGQKHQGGHPLTKRRYACAGWARSFNRARPPQVCSTCSKGFNVLKRRHHCRHCGRVICGSCGKQKHRCFTIPANHATREIEPPTGPSMLSLLSASNHPQRSILNAAWLRLDGSHRPLRRNPRCLTAW